MRAITLNSKLRVSAGAIGFLRGAPGAIGCIAPLGNDALARAPIEETEIVRKRMGWKFPWVSSSHSDFNYDFDVSFTPEQIASGGGLYNFGSAPAWAAGIQDLSGRSVFFKDADGQIYLTYASFGRGGEDFLTAYRFLDVMPKGREENGPYHSLADWVRPHDRYGNGGMVEPNGRYHAPSCACSVHGR